MKANKEGKEIVIHGWNGFEPAYKGELEANDRKQEQADVGASELLHKTTCLTQPGWHWTSDWAQVLHKEANSISKYNLKD